MRVRPATLLVAPIGLVALAMTVVGCNNDQPTRFTGAAGDGERLVKTLGCAGCHGGVAGGGGIGPDFDGVWGSDVELADGSTVTFDLEYLRTSVRDPDAEVPAGSWPKMPPYGATQVSDAQIEQIAAYIQALQ